MDNAELNSLMSALSKNMTDEDLLLSVLQSDIATTIISARISKGLSQKELATLLGVSQGLVSRWENGDTNFTLQTLVKIAIKLGINVKSPYVPERCPHTTCGNITTIFPNTGNWESIASSCDPVWSKSTYGLDQKTM